MHQAAEVGPAEIRILMSFWWSLKPNKNLVNLQNEEKLHYTAKYEAYLVISNYMTKIIVKLKLLKTHKKLIRISHQLFSTNGLRSTESQTTDNVKRSVNGLYPNHSQAKTKINP